MKITFTLDEDIVSARCGSYVVSTKADVPEDLKEALEYLYQEHILNELLEELINEFL